MNYRRRPRLIYLLGFMGSGKSTVGAMLARELGWPFIDLDAVMEASRGQTIREIFEQAGEPAFRRFEQAALIEVSKTEPAVIALGGGTFVQQPNLQLIRATGGVTIWLDCPPDELRLRCEGLHNRPLFRDDASFRSLLEQRLPFYRLADYQVSTEARGPEEVVQEILGLKIF
jgi:shikimate kinase